MRRPGTKNISYLDEEWWKTSDLLYDTKEHLYARDASYSTKTEANGQKMFWRRGNGWVMGGIARTLEYLPKDDPARRKSPAAHSCRLRLKRVQAYLRRGRLPIGGKRNSTNGGKFSAGKRVH